MIELTLPPTPEGIAASKEAIDALDAAHLEYEAWEEKDGSVSFDFGDSDQDAVLDIMRGLGIDVQQSDEDSPQKGDPMYRTEKMIESVMKGADPRKVIEGVLIQESSSWSVGDYLKNKREPSHYRGKVIEMPRAGGGSVVIKRSTSDMTPPASYDSQKDAEADGWSKP